MRLYEIFLTEYFNDSYMVFDESKEDVYKDNFYLRDNLQIKIVSPVISKSKNRDKIIEFTGKFMDEHASSFATSGPVKSVAFTAKETGFFYELFNTTPETRIDIYTKMVEETYYGKISKFITGWVTNAPHKLILTAILCEACKNNWEDMITCCEYLWAFSEYPIVYAEFWKTGVKEDVMNYTIEHLGNKFKVKQTKNIQELLKYDTTTAVEFYKEDLKIAADNTYIDLMSIVLAIILIILFYIFHH